MKLQHFLRLCAGMLFQNTIKHYFKNEYQGYKNIFFFLPRIICVDGFDISIQINNGNYCSTENGYRQFGWEWKTAEWGFPNQHEPLLAESSDGVNEDTTQGVGSCNIELLQTIFDNHGGIDWDKTTSQENFKNLYER